MAGVCKKIRNGYKLDEQPSPRHYLCENQVIRMMRTVISLTALAVSACSAAAVGNCSHSLPNNQVCPDGHGPYFYADPDHCSM